MATKKTLRELIGDLSTQMGSMKQEMGSMKQEMGSMKQEMGSKIDSVKQEMESIKKDMNHLTVKVEVLDLILKQSSSSRNQNFISTQEEQGIEALFDKGSGLLPKIRY